MSALLDNFENSLVDFLYRGQSLTVGGQTISWSTAPTYYVGLFTVMPTDAGGGTEVSGGSYARVPVQASLVNFAGTQGAGSTTASTGTSGQTSNNASVTFPTPTADWGTAVGFGLFSTLSGGTPIQAGALNQSLIIQNGQSAPMFEPGAIVIKVDN